MRVLSDYHRQLLTQQVKLRAILRAYNRVVDYKTKHKTRSTEQDIVVICDSYYEIHSKLLRVEDSIRQIEIEEADGDIECWDDHNSCNRMYDV